jgi:hypothetical protein
MRRGGAAGAWMAAAFAAALLLAVSVLAARGTDAQALIAALRLTARFSYLLFWPAYVGGALARLMGPRLVPLAERVRRFGLAFAAAHLVHLGLVVWLYRISPRPPLSPTMFLFFSTAMAWVYLLALLSVPRLAAMLGRRPCRLLRRLGSEYIAFAFFVDFVVTPLRLGVPRPLEYLPFALLAFAAPLLRLTALARGSARGGRASAR